MTLNDNQNKKKIIGQIVIAAATIAAVLSMATKVSFAQANEYISVYQRNSEILENNGIVSMAVRGVSWALTKLMVSLASASEKLYDTAFGFVDFTSSPTIEAFMEDFKPILWALCALSLLALGFILIMKHEKKPELGINILLMILCLTCGTMIFSELGSWTKAFKDGVMSSGSQASPVYEVVDNNLVDLVDLGTEGGKYGSLANLDYDGRGRNSNYTNPGISEETFDMIDYNEVLNYKDDLFDWDDESREILRNKLVVVDPDAGIYTTAEVYNGFGWNSGDDADLLNQFYYRYTFDSVVAWMQLGALILIYITMSYKCVRIAFELIVARLLASLYSVELSGGEKIRRILVFIRDSYILLAITTICIKVYALLTGYIQQTGIDGIVQGLFSVFIAFAVIDGPNLVERLLGMDAGLKSSTSRLMAAYAGAKTLAKGGANAVRGGVAAGKTIAGKFGSSDDNKPDMASQFKGAADSDEANGQNMQGQNTQGQNTNQQNNQTTNTNDSESRASSNDEEHGYNTSFMNSSETSNDSSIRTDAAAAPGSDVYSGNFEGAKDEPNNVNAQSGDYNTDFMNGNGSGSKDEAGYPNYQPSVHNSDVAVDGKDDYGKDYDNREGKDSNAAADTGEKVSRRMNEQDDTRRRFNDADREQRKAPNHNNSRYERRPGSNSRFFNHEDTSSGSGASEKSKDLRPSHSSDDRKNMRGGENIGKKNNDGKH